MQAEQTQLCCSLQPTLGRLTLFINLFKDKSNQLQQFIYLNTNLLGNAQVYCQAFLYKKSLKKKKKAS